MCEPSPHPAHLLGLLSNQSSEVLANPEVDLHRAHGLCLGRRHPLPFRSVVILPTSILCWCLDGYAAQCWRDQIPDLCPTRPLANDGFGRECLAHAAVLFRLGALAGVDELA